MREILVACRTGMGSSTMLKIKVSQVVKENNFPFNVTHDTMSAVSQFSGDLLITLEDLVPDVEDKVKYVIGIKNLMNKEEIKSKIEKYLEEVKE
ncbi:PTS sugar transporter subunit IIB [Oceanobacillus sp. FSL W8-0428]|uniref:PTS ascorbate transporter subunit IIB n=1 Tax=Oceanobacillus sojae TaxID=582851 RepID=A0A511ZHT1_9BACI|nr:PTS sugar transporter subunit IIB [Oceanobacillus sojae]MCT1901950.1 PTS sugar transporter subunit IIB [Oceanobacillus sojae]GEN86997.1 PTS ascorbate transporter subunit IIB [Oceanobacillus sojae]